MKAIANISGDLDKFTQKLQDNLKQAQRDTAERIWEHLAVNANMRTGAFIASIEIDDTKQQGDTISTFIGSDLTVTSKAGKSYNLGQLLETGTMPHAIPNAFGWGEDFGIDPNFHPGMRAYNNYRNALNENMTTYKDNIRKAIKESKWEK